MPIILTTAIASVTSDTNINVMNTLKPTFFCKVMSDFVDRVLKMFKMAGKSSHVISLYTRESHMVCSWPYMVIHKEANILIMALWFYSLSSYILITFNSLETRKRFQILKMNAFYSHSSIVKYEYPGIHLYISDGRWRCEPRFLSSSTGVCHVCCHIFHDAWEIYRRFGQVLRWIHPRHIQKAQTYWCIFILHHADGHFPVCVLCPGGNFPVQLIFVRFYFLRWIVCFRW